MIGSDSFVYSALGRQLEVFKLDIDTGSLTLVQSILFDEAVQYAWPNRVRTILYIISSGSGPTAKTKVPRHFLQAFRIMPDGTLRPLQEPLRLGNRPIFVSLSGDETHLLVAYNNPSNVTVHNIGVDGAVGDEVLQAPLYFGVTVHQVRVTPHGNIAVVPACAHDTNGITAGCVDLFDFNDGHLTPRARITADPARVGNWRGVRLGAQGFSARHVDFHPTRPWMYLSVEAQGELQLYDYDKAHVALTPRFIKSTLDGAPVGQSAQLGSAVHIHPNGRFIYVVNRAWDTDEAGVVDGANTLVVFEIDLSTGEPHLIQQIDTRGIFPRTFGMDSAGKMLVAGNQEPGVIRSANATRSVVPSLVSYRIGDDGRLTFVHQHDHPNNGDKCFWMSVLTLGGEGN